jgi:hypothetical protein
MGFMLRVLAMNSGAVAPPSRADGGHVVLPANAVSVGPLPLIG